MWIEIEANFSDWIVIQAKIKMKYIFQRVHQRLCHTILGFESNHMKVKTKVKIENTLNQGHFSF